MILAADKQAAKPAMEGGVRAFYGVRYLAFGLYSTLVPTYFRRSAFSVSIHVHAKPRLNSCSPFSPCGGCMHALQWCKLSGQSGPDILAQCCSIGAFCSIQACALRSPPAALVPRRSDAVGSREVFESFTRRNPMYDIRRSVLEKCFAWLITHVILRTPSEGFGSLKSKS